MDKLSVIYGIDETGMASSIANAALGSPDANANSGSPMQAKEAEGNDSNDPGDVSIKTLMGTRFGGAAKVGEGN